MRAATKEVRTPSNRSQDRSHDRSYRLISLYLCLCLCLVLCLLGDIMIIAAAPARYADGLEEVIVAAVRGLAGVSDAAGSATL